MVFGTIVFYGLFPFDISGNLDYKETGVIKPNKPNEILRNCKQTNRTLKAP